MIAPYTRRKSRQLSVGNVAVGGDAPISTLPTESFLVLRRSYGAIIRMEG